METESRVNYPVADNAVPRAQPLPGIPTFAGEGSLELQDEELNLPIAESHPLEDLCPIVGPFEGTGGDVMLAGAEDALRPCV